MVVEHPALIDKAPVFSRLLALTSLILLASCASNKRELSSCWVNTSFQDGQRVAGRVTILISDQMDGLMDGSSIIVSPLSCESGSFKVENPPANLTKLRRRWAESRPIFGSVYEADVSGTVRIIQRRDHAGGNASPYYFVISRLDELQAVQRPRWWKF